MYNFIPLTAAARAAEISPETWDAFEEMRLAIAKYYNVDPDTVQLMITRCSRFNTDEPSDDSFGKQKVGDSSALSN